MGKISTTIELQDKVTSTLQRIIKKIDSVGKHVKNIENLSNSISSIGKAGNTAANAQQRLKGNLQGVSKELEKVILQQDRLTRSANNTAKSEEQLKAAVNKTFKSEQDALRAHQQAQQAQTNTKIKQEQLTQAVYKTWQNQEKHKQSIEKTAQAVTKTAIEQQKLAQATYNTWIKQEKHKQSIEGTRVAVERAKQAVVQTAIKCSEWAKKQELVKQAVERTKQATEKTKQAVVQTALKCQAWARGQELVKQALERTKQAQEKTKQAFGRTRQIVEKIKQAVERTRQSVEKTKQSVINTAVKFQKWLQAIEKTKQAQEKTAQAVLKTKNLQELLNNSVLRGQKIQQQTTTAVEQTNNAKKRGLILDEQLKLSKLKVIAQQQRMTREQEKFNQSQKSSISNLNSFLSNFKRLTAGYIGVQTVGSIIKTADSLAANEARLNLMVKEGESVQQVSDQIYAAAMRSRSSYLNMADAVAKVGIQAGNLFSNTGDMVRFMETFNKMAVISKATTQQTNAAMTQLIQGLSFGQLRGDELKSILENMPMVAHALADEMTRTGQTLDGLPEKLRHIAADGKVTAEEIRELGYEGQISAETVVNAMLNGSKKIDKMAKNMSWTWAQVWEVFKNAALRAFTPIFEGISKIIETKRFKRFANELGNVMNSVAGFVTNLWNTLSPVVAWIFDAVAGIYNFIKNNFSFIAPIIWGIVGAFTAYKTALMMVTLWQGLCAFATSAMNIAKVVGVFVTHGITRATARYAKIQLGLNNALYACPLTWYVLAIIAVIVVIYLVVAAINKVCDTTISATGIIFGCVMWLGAVIWNIVAWLINVIIASIFALAVIIANIVIGIMNVVAGVVQAIVNAWTWCCDNVGIIFDNVGTWWTNLWADCYIFFCDFITKVLNKLSSLAEYVQPFAEVLGMDITGKLSKIKKSVSNTKDELVASKGEYKSLKAFEDVDWTSVDYLSVGEAWDTGYNSLGYLDLSDAWDKGYNFGDKVENKVSDFFSGGNLDKLDKLAQSVEGAKVNDFAKALDGGFDDPATGGGSSNLKNPALDKIAGNTEDIKNNTGETAENTEDYSYLRNLAERQSIQKYTLTDLHVNMTNNNSVSSNVDVKEFIGAIAKQLANAVLNNCENAGVMYR